jgi:XTP/dITP diphosphohydrolase/tetrapyrrole methylase family protein/MazG family protein
MPESSTAEEKIYEEAFAEPADRLEAYADFIAIVKQLRRDCPWDREQTHESVKHLLIEEAYEVVEAIDERDWDELAEELGDVFLHVLFHATIAEEHGRFSIRDVIKSETDKLVRRHPHVFGDQSAEDPDAVAASWEEVKQQERENGEEVPASVLEGVPAQLPALLRAHRTQEKAAGVGFAFPEREEAWAKVEEEMAEFRETVEAEAAPSRREEEFGDLLFALVNYARYTDVNPENALRETVDRFTDRFQQVERRLSDREVTIDEADLSEMRRLWGEAKAAEQTGAESDNGEA